MYCQHLRDNDIGYCPHFIRSSQLGFVFCSGTVKSFIHAVFPCWFTTGATDAVDKAYDLL